MKSLKDFFKLKVQHIFSSASSRRKYAVAPDFHNFEKLIALSELYHSGQVYLLSLQYLKDELGSKWKGSSDVILENLTRKINKITSVEDIFVSRSEVEHLVVFSDRHNTEAQQNCGDILRELSISYLGTSYDHNVTLRMAIGKRQSKLLFKEVAYSSKSGDDDKEFIRPGIITTPKLEAFTSPIGSNKKRPYELIYKPIWDKKNNIVSTFMVSIRKSSDQKVDKTGTGPIGYNALENPFCLASMIELDQFMQSIPLPLRRYINFSLSGFPEGFPEARMHEIITSLLKYCQNVTIECDKIPQDISYYKGLSISGICLNVSEKEKKSSEYIKKIKKLALDCSRENINLSLDGIDDVEDLKTMKEADLNFISGNSIGRYSDTPKHIKYMEWNDIVKH